jgi:glycosyltransferase involved in cell wall biosynthesis
MPFDFSGKRVLIFIVAYNAEKTIESVLDRIPQELRTRNVEVLIIDDSSKDATFQTGLKREDLTSDFKITILRTPVNQGYGGNQKLGYRYAIDNGFDVVALLHGDGQYAPEKLPALLEPFIRDEADAVFGSRMINKQDALKGGMPLYKWVGNQVLTAFQNRMLGSKLSEFHSGYRLYSTKALREDSLRAEQQRFPFRHRHHRATPLRRAAHRRDSDPDFLRRRNLPRERGEVRVGHFPHDAAREISREESALRPQVRRRPDRADLRLEARLRVVAHLCHRSGEAGREGARYWLRPGLRRRRTREDRGAGRGHRPVHPRPLGESEDHVPEAGTSTPASSRSRFRTSIRSSCST